MRAVIFGKRKDEIKTLIENSDFEVVDTNPEIVISYGGDGTIMQSE